MERVRVDMKFTLAPHTIENGSKIISLVKRNKNNGRTSPTTPISLFAAAAAFL